MTVDPRTNVVVFQLNTGADEIVVGHAPTLAEDGVSQAWEGVRHKHGAHAGSVVALHAEWEPSPTDVTFIEATFPAAAVTFNFRRPDPVDWDEAFTAARATMLAAAAGNDSGQQNADDQQAGDGQLLPVLWSDSSPQVGLLEAVPHWPVASGRLHLALAVVAMTPRGTLGMYHVTHHQLGEHSFDELMAEACENLTTDLRVNGHQTDDGQLLSLSGTLVSAMVCLPDFYRRLSELSGAKRLVVGLPCPDEIYVADADSPLADTVRRAVHESEYPTTELVPCVLTIEGDHIEVISERDLTGP
ncbi:hypothetical protein [Actinophytocola sp.]|uniref:hypothetical protein n=1 Tax=Actinophytocola sp. TaxID=1872138 RepID=UPI002ED5D6EB